MKSYPFLILLLGAAGCINANQKKPEAKKEREASATPAPQTGTEDDEDPGFIEGDDSDGGGTGGGIGDLLKGCGVEDIVGAEDDKVIYDKELTSLVVAKFGVEVTVDAKIKITKKESVRDVSVKADAGVLSPLLQIFADQNSGKSTATGLPFEQYGTLSQFEAWQGVLCTLLPTTKIVSEIGDKRTEVEFDPPLPSQVSPRAAAERYQQEIGEERVFAGIKAKVVSTTEDTLTAGEEIEGRVTIKKIAPSSEEEDGKGSTVSVSSDIAYQMTFDFGSAEITQALGLIPVNEYYIVHEKKDFAANITEIGISALKARVVFIHP